MESLPKTAVIMAGGRGERLFPASTPEKPKQFLPLIHPTKSMIQLTVDRVSPIVLLKNIFVVTNQLYEALVREQLPQLPPENIILEPAGKNTAPCIGLATGIIKKRFRDALVVVLASDHYISDNKLFQSDIEKAFVKAKDGGIATIGIKPTRIETDYGYIKVKSGGDICKVEKFVEKPQFDIAKQYCDSGNYVWNSGIFIWKNSVIEDCIKKHAPDIADLVRKISVTGRLDESVTEIFNSLQKISIDHAIMEKIDNIFNISASFDWDDAGGWAAVDRLNKLNIISKWVLDKRPDAYGITKSM